MANLPPRQRKDNDYLKSTIATKFKHTDYCQWLEIKDVCTASRKILPNSQVSRLNTFLELSSAILFSFTECCFHKLFLQDLSRFSMLSSLFLFTIGSTTNFHVAWFLVMGFLNASKVITYLFPDWDSVTSLFFNFLICVKSTTLLVNCQVPTWFPESAFLPPLPPPICCHQITSYKCKNILQISKAKRIKRVLEHPSGIQYHITIMVELAVTWVTSLVSGSWSLFRVKKHEWVARQHSDALHSFGEQDCLGKSTEGNSSRYEVPHCPL